MIFGECDNSSLTHLGKHKHLILFVRWRHNVTAKNVSGFTLAGPPCIYLFSSPHQLGPTDGYVVEWSWRSRIAVERWSNINRKVVVTIVYK